MKRLGTQDAYGFTVAPYCRRFEGLLLLPSHRTTLLPILALNIAQHAVALARGTRGLAHDARVALRWSRIRVAVLHALRTRPPSYELHAAILIGQLGALRKRPLRRTFHRSGRPTPHTTVATLSPPVSARKAARGRRSRSRAITSCTVRIPARCRSLRPPLRGDARRQR